MAKGKQRRDCYSRKQRAGRRRKKTDPTRRLLLLSLFAVFLLAFFAFVLQHIFSSPAGSGQEVEEDKAQWKGAPEIDVQLLPINEYSRSGKTLEEIKGIVVHYTANPGSTAKENRDYFANLGNSHITKASSHFVVGLEGEIVQCIPSNEIAYASNDRNADTLSVECCHPDQSGKFNDATYRSLVALTGWLAYRFQLDPASDVIRHYDVTGKMCPKYFVDHQDVWEQFLVDVERYRDSIS